MREFLNSILILIGSSNLTDPEFNSLTIEDYGYDDATYLALDGVLYARDLVSDTRTRLRYYFQARGVETSSVELGTSNIFIGAPI